MSSNLIDEKRHFQRIFYHAEAQLVGEGIDVSCKVLDISLKGCLLELAESWTLPAETPFRLNLNLSDELHISMPLIFTHGSGKLIGCKCEQIDIDSMTNLRRLVELNLGDMELLNRDLSALINPQPINEH
jgi:hypothetical protein